MNEFITSDQIVQPYFCSNQSEHNIFGPTVSDIWLLKGRIHFESFVDFAKVMTREIIHAIS